MRVTFWGTRGSIAKAGPGTVRYGGNTSCVELRSAAGTLVVLDCGTGAHGLGRALLRSDRGVGRGHILISHTHWDHIQGIPFFSPLFESGTEWHIYGPRGLIQSVGDTLAGQMQYTYFPLTPDDFAATVVYHDLVEGAFRLEEIEVQTQYLNHTCLAMGFRLSADGVSVVYATDHEPQSRDLALGRPGVPGYEDVRHARFLEGADLVIHDTQYTAEEYAAKVDWGHSTMEYVVDTAIGAGVKRLVMTHHDPDRDDTAVDTIVKNARARAAGLGASIQVSAAQEGQSIDVQMTDAVQRPAEPMRTSALATPLPALWHGSVVLGVRSTAVGDVFRAALLADRLPSSEPADAQAFITQVTNAQVALAVLESGFGNTDVLQICRRIRASDAPHVRSLPIVVVVAGEDQANREAGAAAGVTDWLVAPLTREYVRTRVRAWILRVACRWQRAAIPEGEAQRLAALKKLDVLDTEPEERFDRYTRIASALFNVPIALVSLVDKDRQWFKSKHGLETTETPRDAAFCAHAILDPDGLVVTDALLDDRFAENPLVTGEPRIRFYAGVPLTVASGDRVGTLCLVDHRPRVITEKEVGLLHDLGAVVERELQGG